MLGLKERHRRMPCLARRAHLSVLTHWLSRVSPLGDGERADSSGREKAVERVADGRWRAAARSEE